MDKSNDSPRGASIDDSDHRQSSLQLDLAESYGVGDNHEFKVHISRIPTKFSEEVVQRILLEMMDNPEENSAQVELVYPRNNQPEDQSSVVEADVPAATRRGEDNRYSTAKDCEGCATKEHRGFGFITFRSHEMMERALKLRTIKGGRKVSSKKQHTMYLLPYVAIEKKGTRNRNDTSTANDSTTGLDVCYLWSLHRCPYGDECKFRHIGDGGCALKAGNVDGANLPLASTKKKGKCFAFKKGRCSKGGECPFSHDFGLKTGDNPLFQVVKSSPKKGNDKDEAGVCTSIPNNLAPKAEKDCINWKTKGSCRKGERCLYRHDPNLQKIAIEKRQHKSTGVNEHADSSDGKQGNKEKQPLSVRVFGLNYETTEQDIREFFQDCGKIQDVSFPLFEDSGRSKGYCAVWFSSPKAVAKALELDGKELHGRWLRIQSGKMMKEWEHIHSPSDAAERNQRKRFKHNMEGIAPSFAAE